jgi:hypothetical protein
VKPNGSSYSAELLMVEDEAAGATVDGEIGGDRWRSENGHPVGPSADFEQHAFVGLGEDDVSLFGATVDVDGRQFEAGEVGLPSEGRSSGSNRPFGCRVEGDSSGRPSETPRVADYYHSSGLCDFGLRA